MYRKLWYLIGSRARKKASYLIIGFVVMGLLEVIGIASIIPFFSVALDPDLIQSNSYLRSVYELLEFDNNKDFIFFLALVALFFLVIGNLFFIFVNWKVIKFSRLQEHYISKKLFSAYLYKPYEFFLLKNAHTLEKNIILEVNRLVSDLISPSMMALAKIFVVFFIVLFLIIIDPIVAIIVFSSSVVFYLFIYLIVNKFLKRISGDVSSMLSERNKILSDAFLNIREVILRSSQEDFLNEYVSVSFKHEITLAKVLAIGVLPRYIFEVIAFGSILVVAAILIVNDKFESIPYVALYAFAGYRILPAMQQIYFAVVKYKYAKSALNIIYQDSISALNKLTSGSTSSIKINVEKDLIIKLSNISYVYPKTKNKSLNGINLEINKGIVGVVGKSGSGKSTLMDLIMGLIPPTSGEIFLYDSVLTKENISDWQGMVSYVSQDIHLTSESIAKNITFSFKQIDRDKMIKACKISLIHDFIMTVEDDYEGLLHANGINLSGGQRQRIGIARALYNNTRVLVMDEATSALDSINEKKLLKNIENAKNSDLIIISSHNVHTLMNCNEIILMEDGHVVDVGSFNYLIDNYKLFSDLVNA